MRSFQQLVLYLFFLFRAFRWCCPTSYGFVREVLGVLGVVAVAVVVFSILLFVSVSRPMPFVSLSVYTVPGYDYTVVGFGNGSAVVVDGSGSVLVAGNESFALSFLEGLPENTSIAVVGFFSSNSSVSFGVSHVVFFNATAPRGISMEFVNTSASVISFGGVLSLMIVNSSASVSGFFGSLYAVNSVVSGVVVVDDAGFSGSVFNGVMSAGGISSADVSGNYTLYLKNCTSLSIPPLVSSVTYNISRPPGSSVDIRGVRVSIVNSSLSVSSVYVYVYSDRVSVVVNLSNLSSGGEVLYIEASLVFRSGL